MGGVKRKAWNEKVQRTECIETERSLDRLSPCEGLCTSTPLPLRTVIDHCCIDPGYQISDACCSVKCVYASRGSI